MALGPRARVLLIAAVGFAALAALVWYLSVKFWTQPVAPLAPPTRDAEALPSPPATDATAATPTQTPAASPTIEPPVPLLDMPTPAPSPLPPATPQASTAAPSSSSSSSPPAASSDPSRLVIPVAGIRPEQLSDTYNDARSEGRVHNAIDIIAPRGTPVLAAADGRVVRLFNSVKGGLTIYQLGTDERTVYYYAHLDRYADGLKDGHVARRGETIGYVGDTGNATPGNYHLHFQVYRIADPKHFWDGDNLNPYDLLK